MADLKNMRKEIDSKSKFEMLFYCPEQCDQITTLSV